MRNTTHRLVLCLIVGVSVLCLLLSGVSLAGTDCMCLVSLEATWTQGARFIPPPKVLDTITRVVWIGVLEGTWNEMGIQYGQRAAKEIRISNEAEWGAFLKRFEGDTEAMIQLARAFEKHLSYLSPEMIDFMEGIAEGAGKELDKSVYAGQASNYMRILCQNLGRSLRPQWNWKFLEGKTASVPPEETSSDEEHGCQGWWVTGAATTDGETYISRHSQGGFIDGENANTVAFVLIPEDPRAKVTYSQAAAGSICSGNAFNENGVYGALAGCWSSPRTKTGGLGVKDYIAILPAVVYANNAREAKDYILYGTPRYRRLTGRKTLLRTRGSNFMFADQNEAFIVEKGARRFAVRTPGYLGEKGNNYLCFSNHYMYEDGHYDENNVFHSDVPMNQFCPEEEGNSSYYRLWEMMWWFNNNYGNIDLELLMRDLSTAHYSYDKDGNRYDPDPVTGLPTVGTICNHGGMNAEYPLGKSGSWNVSIAIPRTLEIYFLPGWPCQFKDHDWNYINLKLYSNYRKAVYGL